MSDAPSHRRIRPWIDVFLVTALRPIDRRLLPGRYWTDQELAAACAEARRTRERLGWH